MIQEFLFAFVQQHTMKPMLNTISYNIYFIRTIQKWFYGAIKKQVVITNSIFCVFSVNWLICSYDVNINNVLKTKEILKLIEMIFKYVEFYLCINSSPIIISLKLASLFSFASSWLWMKFWNIRVVRSSSYNLIS